METTNHNPRVLTGTFQGTSDQLKITERFTRLNEDAFKYEFTVDDPKTWTQPWKGEMPFVKINGPIFEHACHEGNYGIANTLNAYRLEEKKSRRGRKAGEIGGTYRCESKLIVVAAAFALLAAPYRLLAHHAFAQEFDVNKPVTLKGTMKKWDMINPHSWFYIDVKGTDGKVVEWMVEGGSPNTLIRLGVTKYTIEIGTELTVEGIPG